jgi:predicted lipoprotein with Yx(FWY)xxD motif
MSIVSMRKIVPGVALVALALGATACGSDDAGDAAATTVGVAATSTAGAAVTTASSPLGTILVDSQGRTLYTYQPDEQGPSRCTGQCIADWPALEGPASPGAGIDASKLATAPRADGSQQVTYDRWPLYHFAGDTKAGDTHGQGVDDVWYVVGTDGTPMRTTGATTTVGGNAPGY